MELRLPLEVFPGRQATCRAVFGTWGSFPDDARASHCPFVLTSFTGWSSKRCPGIGFLSRGDREIGVLRNVEPPTRPRLECLRETGLILRCDRKVGNPFQTKQGSRPSRPDQEGRKGSEEGVPGALFLNIFRRLSSTQQAFWLSASWILSISMRLSRRSGARMGVMASMRR